MPRRFYHAKLMDHLRTFEDEDHQALEPIELVQRWIFTGSEDKQNEREVCPCGKTGIRYLQWIMHTVGRKATTFVGSTCIKLFKTRRESVMIVYSTLLHHRGGIRGKFHGMTNDEEPKLKFRISRTHCLVKRLPDIRFYFNSIPVKVGAGDMWYCHISPGGGFQQDNFNIDSNYHLKLQMNWWHQNGITGFTFNIVDYIAVQ